MRGFFYNLVDVGLRIFTTDCNMRSGAQSPPSANDMIQLRTHEATQQSSVASILSNYN